jgi:hypothetical protein
MHGHELLQAMAAIVLVTSGTVLVPSAWLARRRVGAAPGGAARRVVETMLLGAVGMVSLVAIVALIASAPVAPHH